LSQKSVQIPAHSGVQGFLRTIEQILRLRGLGWIRADRTGLVTYEYDSGDEDVFAQIEDAASPKGLVSKIDLTELVLEKGEDPVIRLLEEADGLHMYPTLFLASDPRDIQRRLKQAVNGRFRHTILGVPIEAYSEMGKDRLVLFAGKDVRGDTQSSTAGFAVILPDEV
jgi:hypothetical protein